MRPSSAARGGHQEKKTEKLSQEKSALAIKKNRRRIKNREVQKSAQ